ncbi:metal ABC transporter solute-binding protein, Zn/Mn family [Sulfurimonas sp.]|uniref:metal ABC transporter solute-binding protein, Zn/Mn family n=1 Tax=Sulfurimonas sp. TaxID=2022749 RepID=UPI002B49173C|nr:zinc ABC transporter substrate-binding protein [Sulfurimonas sp.]
MKKIILLVFILFNALAFAKPAIVVSILPEKTFVQKIAKEMVDITVMVNPGSSPHSYEPKASQMIAISKADIYFSIGVEFEETWLDRFKSQNANLKFVNISSDVPKIQMSEHNHEGEHHHEEEKYHDETDPHTWTSPKNVSIMAHTIYRSLVEIDPKNKESYKSNLDDFIKEIEDTDKQIKHALRDMKPKSKFMVFHPSWGYFANDYNLVQIAVEVDGKKTKAKEMIMIIKEAKEENIKVIFTQPEFSDKSAQIIAKEAKVSVRKTSPLDANWSQNLINIAKIIAKK